MNCKKCGKQIENDAAFCNYCGTKVMVNEPIIDNSATVITDQIGKKRKKVLIAVVIAIIIVILAAVIIPSILAYSSKSKLKTSNSYAKTIWFALDEWLTDEELCGNDFWDLIYSLEGEYDVEESDNEAINVVYKSIAGENECGEVYIGILPDGSSFFIQWRKNEDSPIGQFSCEHNSYSGGNYYTSFIEWDEYKSGAVKWGEYYDSNANNSDNDIKTEAFAQKFNVDVDAQNEAFAEILNQYNTYCYYDETHDRDSEGNCYYCSYYITDINGNGILDLIVQTGSCEADRTAYVYEYTNNFATYAGEFNMWHTSLYERNGNIYAVSGQGDNWIINKLVLSDGNISEKEYERFSSYDDYCDSYGTGYVEFCKIKDFTLLNTTLC